MSKTHQEYLHAQACATSTDPTFISESTSASSAQQDPAQASTTLLADIQAELTCLRAEHASLSESHLRAKAEVENARRRAEEEIAKARKFAVEAFAQSLLPVIDSLEAGLQAQEASIEQIREGAQATLRQLASALERNKVVVIAPEAGCKFDPHQHQAISAIAPNPDLLQEPNTIVSVLQKGYLIADRVLRPALVTVVATS